MGPMIFSYLITFIHLYDLPDFCGLLRLDAPTYTVKIDPHDTAKQVSPTLRAWFRDEKELVQFREDEKR